MKNKIGLVLAGGGAKGAYQIGALKALQETKILEAISGVSGTSIGALNACLLLNNDLKLAENIWLSLSIDSVLDLNIDDYKSLIYNESSNIFSIDTIINIIKAGIFSRESLENIIDTYIDIDTINSSNIICYCTACKLPYLESIYFSLNKRSFDDIKSILCASSALPFIFGIERLYDNSYIDGGVCDNIPIKPLYDAKYKTIYVIHFEKEKIDIQKYKECTIIQIHPHLDIGNLFYGTLNFSKEYIKNNIHLGYKDTMNYISANSNLTL